MTRKMMCACLYCICVYHISLYIRRGGGLPFQDNSNNVNWSCVIQLLDKFSLSGPKVIEHFSCSTQLSNKFQLLIKNKMLKEYFSCSTTLRCRIYHANKC